MTDPPPSLGIQPIKYTRLRLLPRSKAYSVSCSAKLLALSPELPVPRSNQPSYLIQNTEWQGPCSKTTAEELENVMLKLNIDNIGEVAVVECEGRIVHSDAAFKLREVVTLQSDARTVVLDLSQVDAIEGGGLGMLVFLQRWAQDHDIRFKLFNPCRSVRDRLKKVHSISEFDMPTLDELMAVLAQADRRHATAA